MFKSDLVQKQTMDVTIRNDAGEVVACFTIHATDKNGKDACLDISKLSNLCNSEGIRMDHLECLLSKFKDIYPFAFESDKG